MAEITASLVKELRERTGAGMMDCKKALTEANGDIELAIENMRKSGAIKAAKKAGNVAADGVIKTKIDGNYGITGRGEAAELARAYYQAQGMYGIPQAGSIGDLLHGSFVKPFFDKDLDHLVEDLVSAPGLFFFCKRNPFGHGLLLETIWIRRKATIVRFQCSELWSL